MAKAEAPRISWLVEPTFDDDGVQRSAGIDQFGREHGDPVPLAPPIGFSTQAADTTHAVLKRLLVTEREAFNAAIEREEFESEDQANDFETGDDLFPPGNEPWEDIFEFPAEQPGSVTNGPSLASAPVKEGSARQDAAPPVTPISSGQTASGGFGPDVTPGTPPAGTQTPVATPSGGIGKV